MTRALAILALTAATAHAEPESYRAETLPVDAISLGAIVTGFAMPGNHYHDASDAIITAGMLGGFFITPIIHSARGHRARAIGSFFLRSSVASVGAIVGMATATCTRDEWFCGFDRMGPGMVAGLAIAMAIDSIWLTDEPKDKPATWSPVVAPQPGGGTVGFAARW